MSFKRKIPETGPVHAYVWRPGQRIDQDQLASVGHAHVSPWRMECGALISYNENKFAEPFRVFGVTRLETFWPVKRAEVTCPECRAAVDLWLDRQDDPDERVAGHKARIAALQMAEESGDLAWDAGQYKTKLSHALGLPKTRRPWVQHNPEAHIPRAFCAICGDPMAPRATPSGRSNFGLPRKTCHKKMCVVAWRRRVATEYRARLKRRK